MFEVDYGINSREELVEAKKRFEKYVKEKEEEFKLTEKLISEKEHQKELEDMFTKVNSEEIEWQSAFVPSQLDDDDDVSFYFEFDGDKYYLSDFLRVHNNPWFSGDDYPNIIDGVYMHNSLEPLYIHLIGDYAVDVYRRNNG